MTQIKTYYIYMEDVETGDGVEKYVQVASFNQAVKMAKALQKDYKADGLKTEIMEVSHRS